MHSTVSTRNILASRLSSTLPHAQESVDSQAEAKIQGLAGSDLFNQWDAAQFALRGREYSSEFMTRMHHPFGEVLAVLFLDVQKKAIAYHSCFRGDRPSALSHLPGIAKSAQQFGADLIVLAYNMIFDPNATLPDVRRMHARMQEAGVELHDFLLISPGKTRSLLAPTLL